MNWMGFVIFWCMLNEVAGQDFETLAKLPKDSLVNRAVKILTEKESRFTLSAYDQISVWKVQYSGFQKNRSDSLSRPEKKEWRLIVTFSQHTVFLHKKKEYVGGISVDLSFGRLDDYLSETGNSTDSKNDFFNPTRKQQASIAFVQNQIARNERLNRYFERSKDVGHLYIRNVGSSYEVSIRVSRGELYTFKMKQRTGEITKVINHWENYKGKPPSQPIRIY